MAEKKAKAPKAPKEPATTEALVLQALHKAATNPKANWTAASPAGLFNTKDANHLAAIEECTKGERPLLKQTGKTGELTVAGFERVAGELSDAEASAAYDRLIGTVAEDQIGALSKAVAGRLALAPRIEFVQRVLSRTPLAALELTPVLDAAVAAEKAESEARLVAAQKRAEAERAAEAALRHAMELFEERRQHRREVLRREYEIEGGAASELSEPQPKKAEPRPHLQVTAPEPKTDEEKDFRRYTADRLAAAWRDAWTDGKAEGRDYLETAIWNIRGMKMIGEVGQKETFDGRRHESDAPAFTGDAVTVVRPGWLLEVDDDVYVALKAAVAKA